MTNNRTSTIIITITIIGTQTKPTKTTNKNPLKQLIRSPYNNEQIIIISDVTQ